ncbi:putative Rhs repeat-associated core domain-containing protein [Seiridium cardinale]
MAPVTPQGRPSPAGHPSNSQLPAWTTSTQPNDKSQEISQGHGVSSFKNSSTSANGKGGGAIKDMKEKFEVNPNSGSLDFSVPIRTSSSRSEMAPSLMLSYSSGSGNGAFGVGWKLHQGAVTRKTSKGIPKYDTKDVFLLDGDEIVPMLQTSEAVVSAHAGDGETFIVDRFLPRFVRDNKRIERWTRSSQPDDIHWVVIAADNTTTIYGPNDESRVFEQTATGCKNIFSWLPSKVFDSRGNSMEYMYKPEDTDGLGSLPPHLVQCEMNRNAATKYRARYLKSIKYGNRTPNRDLKDWEKVIPTKPQDWMFEVLFDYGEHDLVAPTTEEVFHWSVRKDPFSVYNSGFEIRTYRLCRRILMLHHIPEELLHDDCIVSSTSLLYDENPAIATLSSVTHSGWLPNGKDGYVKEDLAPWEFTYSSLPETCCLGVQEVDNFNVLAFPGAKPPLKAEWVDLDGYGAPGLVVEDCSKTLYYQRNQSTSDFGAKFGPVQVLAEQPTLLTSERYFEDINRNGQLDLVCSNRNSTALGYYEQTGKGWAGFQNFNQILSFSENAGQPQRIDINGDGLQDIIFLDGTRTSVVWHQNLAEAGFGKANFAPVEDTNFDLNRADAGVAIFTADMSGDGLADVVRVSGAQISYWPNLGFGRFGSEVFMGNSPTLAEEHCLDQSRVRFSDVDGSGTTDLLYFPRQGGAKLYCNLSGNAWSDPLDIPQFPLIHDLATVSLVDLFGNGTSCLCWTGPDAVGNASQTLLYMDLANGQKPHILKAISNGMGVKWEIEYLSSYQFYRQDEEEGRLWHTKLHCPVQVVASTRRVDEITGMHLISRFRYHDGIYDGIDQEFAGFAAVEQFDAEDLGSDVVAFARPPVHKKMWYHSGRLDYTIDYQLPDGAPYLTPYQVPDGVTDGEAFRALRGKLLFEEVYSDDNSHLALLPYTTSQHSFDLHIVQEKHSNEYASLRVTEKETTTCHNERQEDDHRFSYNAILETNKFGQPLSSIDISYGRKLSALPRAQDKASQERDVVVLTENMYTNCVDHLSAYRDPANAMTRRWRLLGLVAKGKTTTQIVQDAKIALTQWKEVSADVADFTSDKCKVRLEEHRTYHICEDLSDYLELGVLELFSNLSQSYDLASIQAPTRRSELHEFESPSLKLDDIHLGFVMLDKDGTHWRPGNRHLYSSNGSGQLLDARKSFFSPTRTIDPLGNRQTSVLDDKYLFSKNHIDALGNVTSTTFDYFHLQPAMVRDPNGNQTRFLYGAFGEMMGTAQRGKEGEDVGDSVDRAPLVVTRHMLESFIADPIAEAPNLLGDLTQRTISDKGRYHYSNTIGPSQPCFDAEIRRNQHAHTGATGALSIKVTYLDSQGQPLHHAELVDSGSGTSQPTWCIHGGTLKDNKGEIVREYRPLLSDTHTFRACANTNQHATTYLLDPLGRRIVTLQADHTWSKTIISPWKVATFDAGDTILTSDPSQDKDVGAYFQLLDRNLYFPSWYELRRRTGMEQTAEFEEAGVNGRFHGTPATVFLDALERQVCSVEDQNGLNRTISTTYSPLGYENGHYDGLDRLIESVSQDHLEWYKVVQAIDSGTTSTISDCLGRPVLQWTSAGVLHKTTYDALGRVSEVWVVRGSQTPFLAQKNTYGETQPNPESRNLRNKLFETFDQSGLTRCAEYDFKGNCISKRMYLAVNFKDNLDWSHSVSMEDESWESTFEYDPWNRNICSKGPRGDITRIRYNVWGIPCRTTWQASPSDSPKTVVDDIRYNAEQQPLEVKRGNRSRTLYTYDPATGNLSEKMTITSSGIKIQHKTYLYDCFGRETCVKDNAQPTLFFRNKRIVPVTRYRYDGLGRLISATGREQVNTHSGTGRSFNQLKIPDAASSPIAADGREISTYLEEYQYDLAGNILKMSHRPLDDPSIRGWERTYYYTEPSLVKPKEFNNRLSRTEICDVTETYTYSQDHSSSGCMTSMPGFPLLTWDAENRLKSCSTQIQHEGAPETTFYVYDGEGKRVRKVTERSSALNPDRTRLTETIYMDGFLIHRKYKGDGVRMDLEKMITHIQASVCTVMAETCTVGKTPVKDLLKFQLDPGLEVDDQCRLILYEEYSPFGSTTYAACSADITAPSIYRYASYERDEETGLYHAGHRYYAPWLGRWLSPDPIGTAGGLNLYAYVDNNPISYVDPGGTCKLPKALFNIGTSILKSTLSNSQKFKDVAKASFHKGVDNYKNDLFREEQKNYKFDQRVQFFQNSATDYAFRTSFAPMQAINNARGTGDPPPDIKKYNAVAGLVKTTGDTVIDSISIPDAILSLAGGVQGVGVAMEAVAEAKVATQLGEVEDQWAPIQGPGQHYQEGFEYDSAPDAGGTSGDFSKKEAVLLVGTFLLYESQNIEKVGEVAGGLADSLTTIAEEFPNVEEKLKPVVESIWGTP